MNEVPVPFRRPLVVPLALALLIGCAGRAAEAPEPPAGIARDWELAGKARVSEAPSASRYMSRDARPGAVSR